MSLDQLAIFIQENSLALFIIFLLVMGVLAYFVFLKFE